jgi:hypothetical protein
MRAHVADPATIFFDSELFYPSSALVNPTSERAIDRRGKKFRLRDTSISRHRQMKNSWARPVYTTDAPWSIGAIACHLQLVRSWTRHTADVGGRAVGDRARARAKSEVRRTKRTERRGVLVVMAPWGIAARPAIG